MQINMSRPVESLETSLCSFSSHHLPASMETVELKVGMGGFHSEECLRICLSKFRGVKKVEIQLSRQKVVVREETEQTKIVKTLKRNGFRSEPWCSKTEVLLKSLC